MDTESKCLLATMAGTLERMSGFLTCQPPPAQRENVQRWLLTYHKEGLPFAQSKDDAGTLRALVAAGFVSSTGRTKATGHKLTWRGLMATNPPGTAVDTLALLVRLEAMHEPLQGVNMVYGSRLVPAKNADEYRKKLGLFAVEVAPLIVMNWARIYTDHSGERWAATVTRSGHLAMNDIERLAAVDEGFADVGEAWGRGWAVGERYLTMPPPPDTSNVVFWLLGAGAGSS